MPEAVNALRIFVQNFDEWWDDYMVDFAEVAENIARAHKQWTDDSGSADEAITAFVVGKQSHTKNYSAQASPRWHIARQKGYISPRWQNTYENFLPYEQNSFASAEKAVILTHFVKYGYELEMNIHSPLPHRVLQPQTGTNVGGTFQKTADVTKEDFVRACAFALWNAFEKAGMRRM